MSKIKKPKKIEIKKFYPVKGQEYLEDEQVGTDEKGKTMYRKVQKRY